MGPMTLPPGFRFHPTDDELVGYYLTRKVKGQTIELEVIPVIELYKFDPWELPEKSFLPKRDMEWFFFCPRDKKYPNGSRTNRATTSGYWKATGKDRKVFCESSVQGLRKTLVFYRGRAPGGARTDWVMHEYRLCEDLTQATPNFLGGFALCRIVKRNEQGLKTGDPTGEFKGKRCLPSSDSNFSPRKNFSKVLSSSEEHSPQTTSLFEISNESSSFNSSESRKETDAQPFAVGTDQNGFWNSQYFPDAPQNLFPESMLPTQFPYSTESCQTSTISPVSSYGSLTEETYLVDELNMHGCFSALASPLHPTDTFCSEDDITLQGFEWDMTRYANSQLNGFEASNPLFSPMICRQMSDTEEAGLWLQDDSLIVVM